MLYGQIARPREFIRGYFIQIYNNISSYMHNAGAFKAQIHVQLDLWTIRPKFSRSTKRYREYNTIINKILGLFIEVSWLYMVM